MRGIAIVDKLARKADPDLDGGPFAIPIS